MQMPMPLLHRAWAVWAACINAGTACDCLIFRKRKEKTPVWILPSARKVGVIIGCDAGCRMKRQPRFLRVIPKPEGRRIVIPNPKGWRREQSVCASSERSAACADLFCIPLLFQNRDGCLNRRLHGVSDPGFQRFRRKMASVHACCGVQQGCRCKPNALLHFRS